MRSSSLLLLCGLPAVLLGACTASPPTVAAPAPMSQAAIPPPPLGGALVAPMPPPASTAVSGSSLPPATGGAAAMLSADEVQSLLANNTAVGLTDHGVPYEIYFAGNGAAHFREPLLGTAGTWSVRPDGAVCSRLPDFTGGGPNCYQLARYGDVILFESPDGLALGSVRIISGNPQAL